MQDFSGGGQLHFLGDFGYTCREASCWEQLSCESLLWGGGGGGLGACSQKEEKRKWCNFMRFEGYFQPLS